MTVGITETVMQKYLWRHFTKFCTARKKKLVQWLESVPPSYPLQSHKWWARIHREVKDCYQICVGGKSCNESAAPAHRRASESNFSPPAITRNEEEREWASWSARRRRRTVFVWFGIICSCTLEAGGISLFFFLSFLQGRRRPAIVSVTRELNSPRGVREVKWGQIKTQFTLD